MTVGSDVTYCIFSGLRLGRCCIGLTRTPAPSLVIHRADFTGAQILMDYENMSNPHANKVLRFCCPALVIQGLPIISFCQLSCTLRCAGDENSKRN